MKNDSEIMKKISSMQKFKSNVAIMKELVEKLNNTEDLTCPHYDKVRQVKRLQSKLAITNRNDARALIKVDREDEVLPYLGDYIIQATVREPLELFRLLNWDGHLTEESLQLENSVLEKIGRDIARLIDLELEKAAVDILRDFPTYNPLDHLTK